MSELKIKAKNFLGIKEVDLTIDKPLTIIQSENGEGKSSLVDAIRLVLGVEVRNTKAKDRNRLGRNGGKFSIAFALNGTTLRGSATAIPTIADVATKLGVSRKAVPYCLDSSRFLTASPKDLKALFAEVLQLDYDWKAACVEAGCDAELVKPLPATMKTALNAATEIRAESNPGDAPEMPEDPDVTLKNGTIKKASGISIDTVETALHKCESEMKTLVERHAVIFDKHVSDEERKAAQLELAEIEKKIEAVPDVTEVQTKLSEIQRKETKLQLEYSKAKGGQDEHKKLQTKLREWLELDLCQKCNRKITQHELKGVGAIDTLETQLAKITGRMADIQNQRHKLNKKLQVEDTSEMRSRRRQLKDLLDVQTPQENTEEVKKRIDALQIRIDAGRALRDTVRDYHMSVRQHKTKGGEYNELMNLWQRWHLICKTIPEIEKGAVATGLEPLRAILAEHRVLEGDVEIDDDLNILYDGRPIDLMSKAERYIVSLAPYLATLELFQFPFVLIDDGDYVVTKQLKTRLLLVMRKIAQSKPVIFLQARPDDETETAAKKLKSQDITIYTMRDGEARRLAG